jgi:branched-chain amino acid transport system ATP-binding protein
MNDAEPQDAEPQAAEPQAAEPQAAEPQAAEPQESPAAPASEPAPAVAPTGSVLLALEGVVAGFGAMEVLHGVSLTVHEGEIVALIGANGAGKTTTLNVISNVVKTRSGRVSFAGDQTSGGSIVDTVRRGIVHVPEGRRLFSELTVRENLEMGAFLRDDVEGIATDIERMYDLFPILRERSSQRGGSLSGGEQQMLAIARGLMAKPRLLLLDEPSLGLAPIICQQIFRTIKELNGQGVTVFLVEQNAHAALELAHRAYVMETGTIAMEGQASALRDDPRVKAAYLGE